MEKREGLLIKGVGKKALAALVAAVLAVALPQLVHLLGRVTDTGTLLGEMLLPMHLPVILVGMLAGPVAGAVVGAISPALNFALTGMPAAAMLPFMEVELIVYGLAAGLMYKLPRVPIFAKLLIVQLAGRVFKAAAIGVGMLLGSTININVMLTSLVVGLPGLALQWIVIILAVKAAQRRTK